MELLRQASFGLLLAALCLLPLSSLSSPILSGECRHPFPLIMPLDYYPTRCQAWLNALAKARKYVPAYAAPRLASMGLDPRLGLEAVAALLFPVDVTTPELAMDEEIKVYLLFPKNLAAETGSILNAPQALICEMALILEMRANIGILEREWPTSLDASTGVMDDLEKISAILKELWDCAILNHESNGSPDGDTLREISCQTPVVSLWRAQADLKDDSLLRAMAEAGEVITGCRRMQDSWPRYQALWQYLQAAALFVRARAHLRLGQTALAEADLDHALACEQTPDPSLTINLSVTRGELRASKPDISGMCEDYQLACSFGQCQQLANAQRSGQCAGSGDSR